MLDIGKPAPDFTLEDQSGSDISLGDFRGKKVLVYFYPRASTPGCTVQACGLRDSMAELKKLNVKVLGISPDTPQKLTRFTEKQNLNFTLLADPEHVVCEAYGVWQLKKFTFRKFS